MTATLTLWALSDEYQQVADRLIDAGGELTPDLAAELDAIQGAFREKAESVALYLRNLQASAEAAASEARRLTELAAVRSRAADGLKRYLLVHMERTGETKIETDRIRLRVQQNSRPSIHWTAEPELIPDPYRKTVYALDGEKVYQAWKAGTPLPGFTVERGSHLRIA